jgi:hypothetical protein
LQDIKKILPKEKEQKEPCKLLYGPAYKVTCSRTMQLPNRGSSIHTLSMFFS